MLIYIDVLDHHEAIYDGTKATATLFRSEGHGSAVTRIRLDGHDRHEPRAAGDQKQIHETCREIVATPADKILDRRGSDHALHLRHYGRAHDRVQNRLHVAVPHLRHYIPGVTSFRDLLMGFTNRSLLLYHKYLKNFRSRG